MADIISFPNQKWMRLTPLQCYDTYVFVVYNFLDWEVPRPEHLSVFEHKWLDRISGYRHREIYKYIKDTRVFYDARITREIYSIASLPENIRWNKNA